MKYIEDSIKNYLFSTDPDYALMIDGDWGSGKSYYFQKIALDNYKDYDFIYTSAYGIKTPDQLINQIAIQKNPLLKKINSSKPLRIGANLASSLFKAVLPMLRIGSNVTEDENIAISGNIGKTDIDISDFWSFSSNDVIIIDDIERSKTPIDELFGFISTNFLNPKTCKMILICSEKELIKVFQKESDQGNQYIRSKEKVVRHTIKFEWSPEVIAPLIVQDVIDNEELKSFLIAENSDFLVRALECIKGKNLRKFKFFLSNIEHIFCKIGLEELKTCYKSLFPFLFIVSIEHIEGRFANDKSYIESIMLDKYFQEGFRVREGMPDYRSLRKIYGKPILRTEQIYNLATKGFVDFEMLLEDIEKYKKIDNPLNDWYNVFQRINKFEILNQADFTNVFSSSMDYAKDEKYDVYALCSLSRIYCDLFNEGIILDFATHKDIEQFILPLFEKAIEKSEYQKEEHPDDQPKSYMSETPTLKTRFQDVHRELRNKKDFNELNSYLEEKVKFPNPLDNEKIERILRNNDEVLIAKIPNLFLDHFEFAVYFVESLESLAEKIDIKRANQIVPALINIKEDLRHSGKNTKGNMEYYHINKLIKSYIKIYKKGLDKEENESTSF